MSKPPAGLNGLVELGQHGHDVAANAAVREVAFGFFKIPHKNAEACFGGLTDRMPPAVPPNYFPTSAFCCIDPDCDETFAIYIPG